MKLDEVLDKMRNKELTKEEEENLMKRLEDLHKRAYCSCCGRMCASK